MDRTEVRRTPSGNLPGQTMTIQLAVHSGPDVIDLLREILTSEKVRDQIEMEVESVLLFEVANELETETPADIDVEWQNWNRG